MEIPLGGCQGLENSCHDRHLLGILYFHLRVSCSSQVDWTPVWLFLTGLANRFIYTLSTVIAELGYTAGIAVCADLTATSWDEVSLTTRFFTATDDDTDLLCRGDCAANGRLLVRPSP